MAKSRSRRPAARRPAARRPDARRPARAAAPPPFPPGLRGRVERYSARPLTVLVGLPRFVLPLLLGVLLVAGLLAGGVVALLCLLPVLVLVGWLTYLGWPRLDARNRVLRLLLLGLLVGALTAAVLS